MRFSIHIGHIIPGLALLVVAWIYYYGIRLAIAEIYGNIVIAEIIKVPDRCGRRNSIQVKYNNNLYSLPISKSECRRREFTPGYSVQVLYYQPYDMVKRPDRGISAINGLIVFTVIILVIAIIAYLKQRR